VQLHPPLTDGARRGNRGSSRYSLCGFTKAAFPGLACFRRVSTFL
jgi:hypothetical protein